MEVAVVDLATATSEAVEVLDASAVSASAYQPVPVPYSAMVPAAAATAFVIQAEEYSSTALVDASVAAAAELAAKTVVLLLARVAVDDAAALADDLSFVMDLLAELEPGPEPVTLATPRSPYPSASVQQAAKAVSHAEVRSSPSPNDLPAAVVAAVIAADAWPSELVDEV